MSNTTLKDKRTKKSDLRRIEVNELPKKIPNFKRADEPKDILISRWIKDLIKEGLSNNTLKVNELLPNKADLAYYLGVSVGTVQNAIRYVEDEGFLESKQRIGTLIKDVNEKDLKFRKLTSKRERAILQLKKYIVENNLSVGSLLPSARGIGLILGCTPNTTRLVLEHLSANGFIKSNYTRGVESNWEVLKVPELSQEQLESETLIEAETLVKKVEEDLKAYIQNNYKIGDKVCSHSELSEVLDVSIKTIHDAMRSLIAQGYLMARRGRYGTTVVKMPNAHPLEPLQEGKVVMQADDAAFYNYQKIENYIKNSIKEKYNVGDRLPSMDALSKELSVSTNTVKKALQNLHKFGYVEIIRGRYGGTFVADIPEDVEDSAFKWLAVNPQYVNVYKN